MAIFQVGDMIEKLVMCLKSWWYALKVGEILRHKGAMLVILLSPTCWYYHQRSYHITNLLVNFYHQLYSQLGYTRRELENFFVFHGTMPGTQPLIMKREHPYGNVHRSSNGNCLLFKCSEWYSKVNFTSLL